MGKKKKKEEELLKRILSDEKEPQSRARRVRMLLKKNEAVFKDKKVLTDFKEPILQLIRRSGEVEFYEDASKGSFVFKHSDGQDREIYLNPSGQLTFDYGKRKFKGYICYEDSPTNLPEHPRVTAETINGIVEKATMDMRKMNSRKQELQLKTIKVLGMLALGAGLLYILYKIHAFDKIIGLITGQPYHAPVDTGNVAGGVAGAINNNSLDIASG